MWRVESKVSVAVIDSSESCNVCLAPDSESSCCDTIGSTESAAPRWMTRSRNISQISSRESLVEMIEIFSDWKLTDESKHIFYHSIKANCWKEFESRNSTMNFQFLHYHEPESLSQACIYVALLCAVCRRGRGNKRMKNSYKKPQTHCN